MLTASFQGLVQYVWHDFRGIVGSIHTCCISPGWFGAVRYLLLYEFREGWQGNEQERCGGQVGWAFTSAQVNGHRPLS